jgi:hypothetical protein
MMCAERALGLNLLNAKSAVTLDGSVIPSGKFTSIGMCAHFMLMQYDRRFK